MPPKGFKKTESGFKRVNSAGVPIKERPVYSIDDLLLPRSKIVTLAKLSLSENTQLPKDGVTAMTRGASVFINYLCAEANQICQKSGRKTLTHLDIAQALERINMGGFVAAVNEEVELLQASRKAKQAEKQADSVSKSTLSDGEELDSDNESENDAEGEQPPRKVQILENEETKDNS